MDRRSFLRQTAIAGPAAVIAPQAVPAAPPSAEAKDVTLTLARYLIAARFEDLPEPVRTEAARSLLNWMAVAVGGSRHEAVEIALAAVSPFAGPPRPPFSAGASGSTP